MKQFGLSKSDKLCSSVAIDNLFAGYSSSSDDNSVCSIIAYPLRAVWKIYDGKREDADIKFFISVPKKRLRHAVDRVKMRRRIREAYRLNKHNFIITIDNTHIDLALIYISDGLKEYTKIDKAISKIINKINETLSQKDIG